jgi:hypothetical protein
VGNPPEVISAENSCSELVDPGTISEVPISFEREIAVFRFP